MIQSKQAFSLVELSIVLVILGLLVGGILGGQSLIHAAELRAVSTEYSKYTAAMNSFRDKYFYYPGDLPNAYQFWGAACGTDTTTMATGCNGNGNGYIDTSLNGEGVKIWEHLSRAGLMEGQYDGSGTIAFGEITLSNTNSPASKFPSAYWGVVNATYNGYRPATMTASVPANLNILQLGQVGNSGMSAMPSMTNEDAWNIDTKLDDGIGDKGNVVGVDDEFCGDYGADPSHYKLSDSEDRSCVLTFTLR